PAQPKLVPYTTLFRSVIPSPSIPAGHAPQVKPSSGAGASVHSTPSAQGPAAHPSTSTHVIPSPSIPGGQPPQVKPSPGAGTAEQDQKSTRLNSSHVKR